MLILREVLRWQASEVAELLDTSVASVNSALQRARATLAAADLDAAGARPVDSASEQELLARYVDAFERYDIHALVALLHEDATFSMPPVALWLRGRVEVERVAARPGHRLPGLAACCDVAPTAAPAFAHRPAGGPGAHGRSRSR